MQDSCSPSKSRHTVVVGSKRALKVMKGREAHVELDEGEEKDRGEGGGGAERGDDGGGVVDELARLIQHRPGNEGAQEHCDELCSTTDEQITLSSIMCTGIVCPALASAATEALAG